MTVDGSGGHDGATADDVADGFHDVIDAGRRHTAVDIAASEDAFERDGSGLEVAVVGAGAIGVTAAYDLARRGVDVTLYDRGAVASGSSGRAAGLCYTAFADELDAEIGRDAIDRFRTLSGEDTFSFTECPYVWLARDGDERGAKAIRADVTEMQHNGVAAVEMDAATLADRFPTLRSDDVAVAAVVDAAGYTDPGQYTASLAAAANGAGATIASHTRVAVRADPPRIVDTGRDEQLTFDAVLVAAGAHSKQVLADAGFPLAMKPYRVQAITASAAPQKPICYDATAEFYVRPHPTGLLAGNGTESVEADPDDWRREANTGFGTDLSNKIAYRFPAVEPTVERAWAGLCTATPDRNPLVGSLTDGLYVATGFHGHGFMRSPAIGDRIAAQIVGATGIGPFDPTRFSGDESFEIVEGMSLLTDGKFSRRS